MALTPLMASISLVLGGALWGVYWLPIRYLEGLGLTGPTAGIALYLACAVILLPGLFIYRQIFQQHWRLILFSGLLTGSGFSLFTTALAYTDVIRAILLFYLTPIWGTVLGIIFLNEKLTSARILAIILAFVGLYIILSNAHGLPIPRNLGDVFALLSGIAWAIGSLGLVRAQAVPAIPQMISFVIGGLVISLITIVALGNYDFTFVATLPYSKIIHAALIIALYAVPMIWLTIAPARILSPARVGILLMSEVVVGALTAALLSGQEFGLREAIGTMLIIAAALAEIGGAKQAERT